MNIISRTILIVTILGTSALTFANNQVVNKDALSAYKVVNNDEVINNGAFHRSVTVKEALTLRDDTKVQLKGYIVKAIGDEKYEFKDNTGRIMVDIDDDLWYGRTLSAKTPVTIIGEVDIDYKPMKRVEIDVDAVIFD